MDIPRISASSYSNTAPLVWSFLYGSLRGNVEIILDNAPARSAELLSQNRVQAALVPVIAYQSIDNLKLVPGVCVGAREKVRSVCLVTRGMDLADAKSVSLDTSSRTSVALSKIIFKEFLGFEPNWRDAAPNVDAMLDASDAALIIGDPALALSLDPQYRVFDLVELWRSHTGLGFIFAMWMTRDENVAIDFAAARDEGLAHADDIAANYAGQIGLSREEMKVYLTENITYTPDASMLAGTELYFSLAEKHGLIEANRPLNFT
jgi:chorismate dehydratase